MPALVLVLVLVLVLSLVLCAAVLCVGGLGGRGKARGAKVEDMAEDEVDEEVTVCCGPETPSSTLGFFAIGAPPSSSSSIRITLASFPPPPPPPRCFP